jgi:hypothetical protein
MKAKVRPTNGHKYYAYALLYVDDILIVHHDSVLCLHEIDNYLNMKPGFMEDPDFYLGAKVRQTKFPNGVYAWGMSSSKYIQAAVWNIKDYNTKTHPGVKLAKQPSGPFLTGYIPELDTMPKLNDKDTTFYQLQIGVLHWCMELGRVDIITEVSTLSSHLDRNYTAMHTCVQWSVHLSTLLIN